jgi:hypothetical protein
VSGLVFVFVCVAKPHSDRSGMARRPKNFLLVFSTFFIIIITFLPSSFCFVSHELGLIYLPWIGFCADARLGWRF